jgi:hypothetical protein
MVKEQYSAKDQLQMDLAWRANLWSKNSLDCAKKAAEAIENGRPIEAAGYEYLAEISRIDAQQAAFEAGQVAAGGKREGIIPTFTLDPDDPYGT